MTPEQRIDAALDSVLRASGSALHYYTMPKIVGEMRDAMRKVMSDSYIAGSNDNFKAMKKKPCPTCESLARAVMMDQTGVA